MAFAITYKRLFTVRLLHGYYMKDTTGFWNNTAAQQAMLLEDWSYNISNNIDIASTNQCRTLLDGHRMKFQATPTGFSVWVNAEPELAGGTTKYRPLIPLEAGTEFVFRVKARNPFFNNISNLRLRPNLEAGFYFSNYNEAGQMSFPALALDPSLHDNGRTYEMGEKVINGSANVFVAQQGAGGTIALTDTSYWKPGSAAARSFSYRDQLLLLGRFRYYFTPNGGTPVTNPVFTLKSMTNAVLDTQTVTGNFQKNSSCGLDYGRFGEGFFQIEVNAAGYKDIKTVCLREDLYDPYDWGVINIIHRDNLNDFRLLEQDGTLCMNGNTLAAPVFDVRIDSRATYWKYILHPLNHASLGNVGNNYDQITPDTFISKDPLTLNRFQTPQTVGSTKLSQPYNGTIIPLNGKVYSEIFLPKMNL